MGRDKASVDESESGVDTRPKWITANEVGTGEIEYGGKMISYTVLKKEVAPDLPGFLGYPDGEHLFISEEVPKEFRAPQLTHEIIEFTELEGQEGRCLEALKRELAMVPGDIEQRYIEYRRDFFARLVEYYKESEDEDFKAEIQASYEYLQNL
ncbi:MAG: hypothetical protein HQ530_03970 [Parcubacteria group bacterium]|nr:hypothetical protein [Parcubacteria group bacterium]